MAETPPVETSRPGRQKMEAFIRYLAENEIVEEIAARRALDGIGRVDLRVGRIALMEGFVTPEEINKILWVQREALDKKFGEVAVDLRVMTPDEVSKALELQQDELFALCQSLILDGLVAPETLYVLVRGFLERDFDREIERHRTQLHARVSKSIRDVLKKISVVAPMPETVARLMQMLNNPDVDLDDVAKVISLDVGLTAMLIRLSNSAFYGLKSQVTTVAKAVTVLGTKKLRQLVLSAAIMINFKNMPPDRSMQFWGKSMHVGQWCKELSRFAGKPEIDEFFMAGFLHSIGELVIQQHFPLESRQIEEEIKLGASRLQSEIKILGCDNADIGSYLLSLWQMPPAVVQSAMLQHHPWIHLQQMSNVAAEAKVVNMAVAIMSCDPNVNAFGQGMHLGQVVQNYRQIIDIEYQKVTEMRDRVEDTVADLMKWFGA